MKFYGNGIVWDGANNRKLCKFEKGVFVTEDEGIISTLVRLGYQCDPEVKSVEVVETEPVDGFKTFEVKKEPDKKPVEKPIEKSKSKPKRKKVVKHK